jgi:hypothetical protein
MREINEAWEVLRDPGRRQAYDRDRLAGRRAHRPTTPSGSSAPMRPDLAGADDDDLVDVAPELTGFTGGVVRHLPWVVALVVLGAIFVFSAYAGSRDSAPAPTSVPATSGNCVDVASGPVTTVVSCDGPHDLRIVTRVGETQACPEGTERRRLGTDGLLDCVVPGSG